MKSRLTISEYISQSPKESQKKLKEMRKCLKSVTPKSTESIKWGVLAFSYERALYMYAGFKHHIGFYPTASVMSAFKKELSGYKTAKGSVQFPLDKPLPVSLIKKMAKLRIKELKEKDAKWKNK